MGFLDTLAGKSFMAAKDGRWIYFPWGYMGPGYIIPSEEDYQRLKKRVKVFFICYLFIMISFGFVILHWLRDTPEAVLFLIIPARLWFYSQVRHLERADNETIAKEQSIVASRVILGVAIVIVVGIYRITSDWGNCLKLLAWSVIIIYMGCLGIFFAKMIILQRQLKRQAGPGN